MVCGWANDFPYFRVATLEEVVNALTNFVRDTTAQQIQAWRVSITPLQQQCGVMLDEQPLAKRYWALVNIGCRSASIHGRVNQAAPIRSPALDLRSLVSVLTIRLARRSVVLSLLMIRRVAIGDLLRFLGVAAFFANE